MYGLACVSGTSSQREPAGVKSAVLEERVRDSSINTNTQLPHPSTAGSWSFTHEEHRLKRQYAILTAVWCDDERIVVIGRQVMFFVDVKIMSTVSKENYTVSAVHSDGKGQGLGMGLC